MSLIILKVDREKKSHSIWSDGILICGDARVFGKNYNKLRHFQNKDFDILIGCTGSALFSKYTRLYLPQFLVDNAITSFDDLEYAAEHIRKLFKQFFKKFQEEHDIEEKDDDYKSSVLMSINGNIVSISMYEKNVIEVNIITEHDYHSIGQDANAANLMLDLGIEPDTIIKAIANRNCYVSDKVHVIKDVSYEE